ncbi:MAG TPA: M13 family metallopeptidase [Terriglobales bacterium]|nr:M13 family metallopeptidase [Terriglobales bacterium]
MRLLKLCAFVLAFAGLALAQAGNANAGTQTFEVKALDKSVDPCVNFYKFACGSWMANNPIPGDKTRWGRFDELAERNRVVLHDILETYSKPGTKRDAIQQKVGDYYAACMDEKAVNAAGAKPLQAGLQRINAIKNRSELMAEVAHLYKEGVGTLFGFGAAADLHDARITIAHVGDGGISLPDREYYLKEDAKSKETQQRYVAHVQKMFELSGEKPEAAAALAAKVMAVETELAKANMDRVARRDPRNRDHKMTVAELDKIAPNFEINKFFVGTGAPKFTDLNVANPEFFKAINKALETVPLEDWKTYLRWKYVRSMSSMLSDAFVQENFNFWNKYLRGQKELEARWKRCTQYTDGALGEALGQLYVAKNFPPEAKQRTLELVNGIEHAMGADLKTLTWMSDETKKKGEEKLAKVTNKIGYPDRWRDYSSVKILPNDFVGNTQRADEFEVRRQLNKIGKPVDKLEWSMTPPTVNAYYSPSQNNINFPAGILQVPFYHATRDDAVNYGGIGAVIGHELTHGFDDQGAKFDGDGNLKSWWTDTDKAEFEQRTNCLVQQYEQYSPVEGVKLNGKLTLGENTSDNGGVLLAYMAMQERKKNKPEAILPEMEGFTPEQRFFLGWAQVWCQNVTPETARVLAVTDPHSPGEFRVNGVVVNSEAFQKAFSCKAGQPMVSANACRVW